MLEVRSLTKSFGPKQIFDKADFQMEDGQIVGICSPNGSGKSTLGKIMCGICDFESGEVLLDGEPLFDKKGYKRKVGMKIQMVYQEPYSALDPSQRAGDALSEVIKCHKLAKGKKERMRLISAVLDKVSLPPEVLSHLPSHLSGGEAQRVVIAKCLLFNPKVLILDEATSMLDVSTRANILQTVKALVKSENISVLMVCHELPLARLVCDKIYTIKDQKIKEI